MDTGLGWKVGQMDTGLGMEGRTDEHRSRDGSWNRWTLGLGMKGGTDGHRTGMEGGTDGHRTRVGRWDRWTPD